MPRIRKTEHAGAKNGGGYWGTRVEAKAISKKARRETSKILIDNESNNLDPPHPNGVFLPKKR